MSRHCSSRVALAGAILMACAFAALAQSELIAIGPYIQNVGKDSATVCWATRTGQVTYKPQSQDQQGGVRDYDYHKLVLRYLTPGTTYTYDVLGDGSEAGRGSFTTVPDGDPPFRFTVSSDCHGPLAQTIINRMAADRPNLVFLTGDTVSDGLALWQWESFFRYAGDLMRTVPVYPVRGNHELDSPFYADLFAFPGNQRYFSFDRGSTHFVVLDSFGPRMRDIYWEFGEWATNQPVTQRRLAEFEAQKEKYWQEQIAWLKDDLESSRGAKYIFVFFHHSPYTARGRSQEAARATRARFGTIFQDNQVSAVFTGHYHQYHRAVVGGVQFITTLAGGTPYETDAPQPETVKFASVRNYARVEVGPAAAKVVATDMDGKTLDEVEIAPRVVAPQTPQ